MLNWIKRKNSNSSITAITNSDKFELYLDLHHQCQRNVVHLRGRVNTINMISKNITGATVADTKRLRKIYRGKVEWIQEKIKEEEFYRTYYLKLIRSINGT